MSAGENDDGEHYGMEYIVSLDACLHMFYEILMPSTSKPQFHNFFCAEEETSED